MRRGIATIDVRGTAYRLRWAALRRHFGDCDSPTSKDPEIRLSTQLRNDDDALMYVVLHEVLHGGAWDLDESAVIGIARAQAEALKALGYRRASDE